MGMGKGVLSQFEHEMIGTRRTLERVPQDKFDWKPHPKSMALGSLAMHIATIPGYILPIIEQESLDLNPIGGKPFEIPAAKSQAHLIEIFNRNVQQAKKVLGDAGNDLLLQNWSLLNAGNNIFTMPRIGVIHGLVISHLIHHRAQLGVYLRLNDIPVPSIYGPSADEMI